MYVSYRPGGNIDLVKLNWKSQLLDLSMGIGFVQSLPVEESYVISLIPSAIEQGKWFFVFDKIYVHLYRSNKFKPWIPSQSKKVKKTR
jgi:hypothetical protein